MRFEINRDTVGRFAKGIWASIPAGTKIDVIGPDHMANGYREIQVYIGLACLFVDVETINVDMKRHS